MLSCLSAVTRQYKKNKFVLMKGERVNHIGIVLSGKLTVFSEDADGNRNILSEIVPGEMFAEAFAFAENPRSTVYVQATAKSEVLNIDYKKIVATCNKACSFHSNMIGNMLKILSGKILMLNSKLDIISKRTTRKKLAAFFEKQKVNFDSNVFTINFNREELADYLFIDRSSMSRELCKMRDEGLIKFKKKQFEIVE